MATDATPFSPDPRAIRQNSVLFASLCSSLLAATGAVLAKQWLQIYERTGQTGPIVQQALYRTRKFHGAQKWGLTPAVEALPTLLLISLALFFAAMSDYLWTINKTVAITFIAFVSVGAGLYFISFISAAIYEDCPFQTAPTAGVRCVLRTVYGVPRFFEVNLRAFSELAWRWRETVTFLAWKIREAGERLGAVDWPLWVIENLVDLLEWIMKVKEIVKSDDDEMVYARSALWIVETVPENNIILVTENLPALRSLSAVRILNRSPAFKTLLYHFHRSLLALQRKRTPEAAQAASAGGKAVAHILLADPFNWDKAVRKVLLEGTDLNWAEAPRWLISPDLTVICLSLINISCRNVGVTEMMLLPKVPFKDLVDQAFHPAAILSHSTAVIFIQHYLLSKRFSLESGAYPTLYISTQLTPRTTLPPMEALLAVTALPSSDILLGLVSLALSPEVRRLSSADASSTPLGPAEWYKTLESVWFLNDNTHPRSVPHSAVDRRSRYLLLAILASEKRLIQTSSCSSPNTTIISFSSERQDAGLSLTDPFRRKSFAANIKSSDG